MSSLVMRRRENHDVLQSQKDSPVLWLRLALQRSTGTGHHLDSDGEKFHHQQPCGRRRLQPRIHRVVAASSLVDAAGSPPPAMFAGQFFYTDPGRRRC